MPVLSLTDGSIYFWTSPLGSPSSSLLKPFSSRRRLGLSYHHGIITAAGTCISLLLEMSFLEMSCLDMSFLDMSFLDMSFWISSITNATTWHLDFEDSEEERGTRSTYNAVYEK